MISFITAEQADEIARLDGFEYMPVRTPQTPDDVDTELVPVLAGDAEDTQEAEVIPQ